MSSALFAIRDAVLAGAPDPADARIRFERIAGVLADAGRDAPPTRDEVDLLRIACQRAPYLANLLARDAGRLARVARDRCLRRAKPRAQTAAELAARLPAAPADPATLSAALRRYRGDEMVRLGCRELELGSPIEVGRELAYLADAAFDAAVAHHGAALSARHGRPRYVDDDGVERDAELVVVGMGKLGGEELNFSSDVDVIYIYSSDAGAAGSLSLHEYFSRLCTSVTAALHEVTDDDFVFRVDLRLRPEGTQGPIANSLAATERYYEAWGRPWERQAWLKARPCAGSVELGREVMRTLEPFVHPRHTSVAVLREVAELNRRIKAEHDDAGIDAGFDLKNGVGGIREVEFFVQALQLVHGGHRPAVRARSTLAALDHLLFAGLVSEAEQRALAGAYRFLRGLEHLLQLESGRQTQRLPTGEQLELLARRSGRAGAPALERELAARTAEVARLFATVGDDEPAAPPAVAVVLDPDAAPDALRGALAALGFRDVEGAVQELAIARGKPSSPLGPSAGGAARALAPELIAEIAASPDPDLALRYLADLIGRRGAGSALWRLCEESRPFLRLLVSVMGSSEYLAKTLINHPELIDGLLLAGRAKARVGLPELHALAHERLAQVDPGDEDTQWNALTEVKQAQTLRIGLADIAGELSAEEVSAELSQVADVVLARALAIVSDGMRERHGVPRDDAGAPAALAVCALGKLGARELGYASDLDLVFVYSIDGASDGPRPLENIEYMTRQAQRLMRALHTIHTAGHLYEVDTRLRPSGGKGLLVSSLAGWRRYHAGDARLWERQALIKLRPVAGDIGLGREIAAAAAEYVYEGARPAARAIADEVTAMRDRMERELAGAAASDDLKAGRGGIIDVEFAAQYLQLVHGPAHPELRVGSTLRALEQAARLGVADRDDCALLADGYRFLRMLENRMRLVHDRSVHRLPAEPVELDKLARRVAHPDGSALLASCRRWQHEVRAAYARVLAAAP